MSSRFFIGFQYCAPQHFISRCIGKLASCKISWLKNLLIHQFARRFDISLNEAQRKNFEDYESFNDFFCRSLDDNARPICAEPNVIVSPADGCISQLGPIKQGRIFQAKGQTYSAAELLADEELAKLFNEGEFATIYLSPRDYHRVHMPIGGTLKQMHFVPGDLFSVNKVTAENVPRLFSRNERVVTLFDTEIGPVASVLVGAMVVASIETTWAGELAPSNKKIQTWNYPEKNKTAPTLNKGEEMGRFKLGSTVVLLFPKNTISWKEQLNANSPVKMGEEIAKIGNRE